MAATFPDGEIVNSYGQTEMCGGTCALRGEDSIRKMDSVGKSYPEIEARIVDEQGRPVARGEVGEIVYRGPTVMTEYYRNEAATREAFRGGWFHSGDLVREDEEGYLYVVDRTKDVIVSGGENIYPAEVEQALRGLPGVLDVAVVGAPHPKWVESPVAVIVPEPDAELTETEIQQWLEGRLASFKHPRAIVFAKDLPRNAMGKVLKHRLRSDHASIFDGTDP